MPIRAKAESHDERDLSRRLKRGINAVRAIFGHAVSRSLFVALCFLPLTIGAALTEEKIASELEVKATFIYNFASFVEWPAQSFPDANAPLTIGILGEEKCVIEMKRLVAGKSINGRKVEVRLIDKNKDVDGCHVIFIRASQMRRFNTILDRIKDASILLIGETEKFIDAGGIIGFVSQDRRVAFEINAAAAKKRGLKVSSQLLKLAKRVKE